MNLHHAKEGECPLCNDDLTRTHDLLVIWFHWVKAAHPTAHICWAYRDEEDQTLAYEKGLSHARWPKSKHNARDEEGNPCSMALDIFELTLDGAAKFDPIWYTRINQETQSSGMKIRWGGDFVTLKDYDHFEVVEEKV